MTTAAKKFADHNARHNEGGYGYNPHAEKMHAEVRDKIEARMQEILKNFDAYRAAWNGAVQKYAKNGKIAAVDLKKIEQEAGITQNEVALAKSRMSK